MFDAYMQSKFGSSDSQSGDDALLPLLSDRRGRFASSQYRISLLTLKFGIDFDLSILTQTNIVRLG
jgi:hypothetical protein